VKPFKESLVKDGIPYASFGVDSIEDEFNRLKDKGVKFIQLPTDMGPVITAIFDDTCGNLIQIAQYK
jgi:predicted enzyme related to lactoylglutathione lyase